MTLGIRNDVLQETNENVGRSQRKPHRHRARATWAELEDSPDPSWTVHHYWGPYKPWRPAGIDHNFHSTVRYLWRLAALESDPTSTDGERTLTRCTRELQRLRSALRSKGRWFEPLRSDHDKSRSHQPRRGMGKLAVFPILPSGRVAEM